MSRINALFNHLTAKGEKALIAYIMAGDPDFAMTEKFILELGKAGCDMVELGVPFSDPVADGPTIQKAHERARANGVTLQSVIQQVSRLRPQTAMPILIMTYLNPILARGIELFFKESHEAGVDGLIIPDLPIDEAGPFQTFSRRYRLPMIYFIAPTTPEDRIKKIVQAASGFIYYVALTGTTGAPLGDIERIGQQVQKIKSLTPVPVAVGFGIATAAEAKAVSRFSDGVIVGSALVHTLTTAPDHITLLARLSEFVQSLKKALQ